VDLNGDGILDVTSGQYWPGIITFFEGTPEGLKKGVVIPEKGLPDKSDNRMQFAQSTHSFVDWDGDGDLDLVIGTVFGEVFLNLNEGISKHFKFGRRVPIIAAGKPMKAPAKSDPVCVDWDGDGVMDLLVGDDFAGVTFFKGQPLNAGPSRTFEAGVPLIPGQKKVVPGYRARLAVTDWNNDGKLDLLVGNCEETTNKDRKLTGHVYLFLRK
jgi:hypothetical protein